MAGALIAVLLIAPPSADFIKIMEPAQVTQFFRERMFPQHGWFQSRMASTASIPSGQHAAAAEPKPGSRAE